MTHNNIINKIRSRYYSLSPAEQKVANYVLSNHEKIQFMSISELAELVEVSDATVTRFCRSLGLKGFNLFKIELATAIAETRAPSIQEKADGVLTSGEESAADSKKAIDETISLLDKDAIKQVIDLFGLADRVLCAGSGGSMRIANECAHLFSIVEPKFLAVTDFHSQISAIATMKKNDVLLLISYSGATINGMELLELTKKLGIKSILITRFKRSPLAKLADVTLCCGSNEGPYQMGSIAAKIALLTLGDVIFREYRKENAETAEENIKRVASALSDKHL
ncbi:MAG: MurR/RpiR family transcriptional regulator [Clostridia bacterium]|nr:MurR/RpiR family transcriptional regulator [Clostridia bacterium]